MLYFFENKYNICYHGIQLNSISSMRIQQYLQNYLEVILTIEKYQFNYVPRIVSARCQHNMHKDR